jgi:hypothetical protein
MEAAFRREARPKANHTPARSSPADKKEQGRWRSMTPGGLAMPRTFKSLAPSGELQNAPHYRD